MSFPEKKIIINNFQNVEGYLDLEVYDGEHLKYIELEKNCEIEKVAELVKKIPDGFCPERIQQFYEETNLKICVEVYQDNYELTMYDRNGRYPREDAAIWNEDFVANIAEHPEWLEPQEEADILIRYIYKPNKKVEKEDDEIIQMFFEMLKTEKELLKTENKELDKKIQKLIENYLKGLENAESLRDGIFGILAKAEKVSFRQGFEYGKIIARP